MNASTSMRLAKKAASPPNAASQATMTRKNPA